LADWDESGCAGVYTLPPIRFRFNNLGQFQGPIGELLFFLQGGQVNLSLSLAEFRQLLPDDVLLLQVINLPRLLNLIQTPGQFIDRDLLLLNDFRLAEMIFYYPNQGRVEDRKPL
jgi:hypothetical protein